MVDSRTIQYGECGECRNKNKRLIYPLISNNPCFALYQYQTIRSIDCWMPILSTDKTYRWWIRIFDFLRNTIFSDISHLSDILLRVQWIGKPLANWINIRFSSITTRHVHYFYVLFRTRCYPHSVLLVHRTRKKNEINFHNFWNGKKERRAQ